MLSKPTVLHSRLLEVMVNPALLPINVTSRSFHLLTCAFYPSPVHLTMTRIPKPVIAIAGLACETSTFSPSRTLAQHFHPKRDSEILDYYPFFHPSHPLRQSANFRGVLIGHALPGGIVTSSAYSELASEIEDRLKMILEEEGRIDGLWFDIHGAMVVEGLDDSEADLLSRIRDVIGRKAFVSASMDLHGNVSYDLIKQLDLITCYRLAPHEDTLETKERAVTNLLRCLEERRRPVKAWLPLPILLPGEQTSTRMQPAKRIYAQVSEVEKREGMLDAAIWVGYAWGDQPRNQAVVVITGFDEAACVEAAEELGRMFWDAREEFEFVAPRGSLDECLDKAVAAKEDERPYFISDSGDNPTAGGAGDVTWSLAKILARPEFQHPSGPRVIYASQPGPSAIETTVAAGIGATVTVIAGAEIDSTHSGPVTITGRVHSIHHGDPHAETEIVIQSGSVFVILTKLRKPYHKEHDFTQLDLKPREMDIVVVKIGYLEPELYDMKKGWMMALTPGGVDQRLEGLGYERVKRPMWPFDKVWREQPDLRAKIIPASHL